MIVFKKDGWQRSDDTPCDRLSYEDEVVSRIRSRYSVNDELALLRQRDTKPEEFAEYNAFCETCKSLSRSE